MGIFSPHQPPWVRSPLQGAVGAGKPDAARAVGYPDWLDVVQVGSYF